MDSKIDATIDAAISEEEQALRAQVQESRAELERLLADLSAVDGEIEGLATRRTQFDVLAQACDSLEKLEEMGIAGLFWGDAAQGEASGRLFAARKHIDAFQGQVRSLEVKREEILGSIGQQEEGLDILYDELYQAEQAEERRKAEWLIEREVDTLPKRAQVMAWSRSSEEDKRFRRGLAVALAIFLLLVVLIPMVNLPLPSLDQRLEVPDRLVQLIREERAKPIPPRAPEPEPVEELKPEEPKPEEQKPQEQREQPRPDERPQLANVQPEPEAPKQQGILAFRERFSSLARDNVAPRLGADARINSADDSSVAQAERSMLTTNAPGSSGGINLAALSRDVGGGGGGGMAGVQVTRASSSIGAIGTAGGDRPLSGDSVSMGRTDEEIQIVFDRYKAALYRLYNRELRSDPTLRGQMVLRLTIEADGSVSMCELASSDMKAPELSAQVVDRVRTINFGAKDGIPAITILYPIDFLPAA